MYEALATDMDTIFFASYRSDFMIEEEIQHILKYKTPWWSELRAVQKAEKGKSNLARFVNLHGH